MENKLYICDGEMKDRPPRDAKAPEHISRRNTGAKLL